MQFGYPYLIRLSFFRNPVRSGSGFELQNPVQLFLQKLCLEKSGVAESGVIINYCLRTVLVSCTAVM